jgi:hypothetical protein
VRLTVAGQHYSEPLKVVLDPRSAGTPADLAKQQELAVEVARQMAKCVQLTRQGAALKKQLSDAKKTVSDAALTAQIASVESDADKIFGVSGGWDAPGSASGVGAVLADLASVNGVIDSADRMPPAPANALFQQASAALTSQLASWETLKNGKLADLNRALSAKHLKEIDLQ